MKKTAIALAVAGLAAASIAQAAPQENTFYAGARVGWSTARDGISHVRENIPNAVSTNKNSGQTTYGVFGGYQILNQNNFGLAAELGYDYYGGAKWGLKDAKKAKFTNHGVNLSIKPSYDLGSLTPALEGLDVYTRFGAALVRSDYKGYGASSDVRAHSLKVSPLVAAGLEYAIPGFTDLAARVEYQYLHGVGRDNKIAEDADFTPDIHSVTFGLSYRFGQGAVPAPAPEVVNKTFTLNSDVTFAFNKATLRPEAANTLDGVYSEITQVQNPSIAVAGYADRIGKDAANLKLSQHRAETVANYLVSKGVDQNTISATGYGEANPVTGNTCDSVKGRKALIACLAPDRRVEVSVQGSKAVTM
ncbi:porin OmpA [Pasteurellaceae bacterium LIM206]|nr:porin OmpA [Pasteurellaceae bacterium LIM206]